MAKIFSDFFFLNRVLDFFVEYSISSRNDLTLQKVAGAFVKEI